jgi:hypothetical protein
MFIAVAASGGYYISMEAHKILVDPGTITGSIGVFYGKFVTRKMWEKIGVTWDGLEGPSNSKYYNSLYVMDEENKYQKFLSNIVEKFEKANLTISTKILPPKLPKLEILQLIKSKPQPKVEYGWEMMPKLDLL